MSESDSMEFEEMNPENKVKLLITNDLKPYGDDVIRVMAMSPGSSYRFRYYKLWLPTLVDRIRSEEIKPGCRALVVLRQFETGKFMPIRYVKITEIVVLGDTYYIVFEPEEFVRLSDDETMRSQQIEKFNQTIVPLITEGGAYPNTPKENFSNLFCEITDIISDIEDGISSGITSMKAWANIVSELSGWPYYDNKGFFRIFSITPVEESAEKSSFASEEKIDAVKSNKVFAVRALHIQHNPIPAVSEIEKRLFILDSNDDRIIIDKERASIESRYDVAEMRFHLSPKFYGSETTTLQIRYVDGNNEELLYPLYMPIEIRGSLGKFRILKAATLVILLFLWMGIRLSNILPATSGFDSLLVVLMVLTSAFPEDALAFLGLK